MKLKYHLKNLVNFDYKYINDNEIEFKYPFFNKPIDNLPGNKT